MLPPDTALVIVDMQWYYLSEQSSYCRYFSYLWPDSMNYILSRCRNMVIPNIQRLVNYFKENNCPIIYLRLCGSDPRRKDIHRFFRETFEKGQEMGFFNIYPLKDDPASRVIDVLEPDTDYEGTSIITKTTYSAFTSSNIADILEKKGISSLIFSGLATSQCVETTARDASDRGFGVIHIEDAQADYDEMSHTSSLYSSQGVCGGKIYDTESFITVFTRKVR